MSKRVLVIGGCIFGALLICLFVTRYKLVSCEQYSTIGSCKAPVCKLDYAPFEDGLCTQCNQEFIGVAIFVANVGDSSVDASELFESYEEYKKVQSYIMELSVIVIILIFCILADIVLTWRVYDSVKCAEKNKGGKL